LKTGLALFETYAELLERRLGDPGDPTHPLSWARAMERDEAEAFPSEGLDFLEGEGIHQDLVPTAYGGNLRSFEQSYALSRALSRRDPSLALSFAMRIWSQLIWLAGSPEQKAWTADYLLNKGGSLCLAASEAEHGADLLSSEVTAEAATLEQGAGFKISGEKWPIGMASRAGAVLVLARTQGLTGYRSLSWYLVDRSRVSSQELLSLPKIKTLGLRAAELSGLRFSGTPVARDALVGAPGSGLESTLKLFQITRTLVPGLAVGAADTALRLASSFALKRQLYGKAITAMPIVRESLLAAYFDLLAADALMLASVRGLHAASHEFSACSLVTKILVPTLTGRAIQTASEVLGARYYLREGYGVGIFQKMVRDQAAIGLFDGSSVVCLGALIGQLSSLLKGPTGMAMVSSAERPERLELRFNLGVPLPEFDPSKLALITRGCDDVCQGMADSPLELELSREWKTRYRALTDRSSSLDARSPEAFSAGREYCTLYAAAACFHLFERNPGNLFFDQTKLTGTVLRLLRPESPVSGGVSQTSFESIFGDPRSYSVLPYSTPDKR
jgi:alkylation response protein AidB-like acyl-CoA dehydrogenase